jgi:carbamoyltransferase
LARESESYYRFAGSRIETLAKVWLEPARGFLSDEFYNMPGLGALYSRASTYVFGDWNKCGELMGLAAYGRAGEMAPLMELEGGELRVPGWGTRFNRPWLTEGEGGQDWEQSPSMQHWKDLARRVQDDTERVLLERAAWLRETTGARSLCLAGGVALNCVANGRIAREAGFENVWVQPAAGDDGVAIGCAYYGHLAIQERPRSFVMGNAYLGAAYGEEAIAAAMAPAQVRLATRCSRSADICADTARVLADGHVVAWFQGRSELGPRALGNRSILADPRRAEMKAILNGRVKHRQAFRPFAPVVLAERARDIFEGDEPSPYMLIAKRVRPEWKDRIPAVVHVDGSARVQTVDAASNPVLYRLLEAFDALTGVPVLVNTSFNVKGEPMVETPQDAMACFLETGIDYLVLHDTLIGKSSLHRVLTPIVKAWSDVRRRVRAAASA